MKAAWLGLVGLGTLLSLPAAGIATQPLETETARVLPSGALELETTFEYQTSSEGQELATPLALEYGVTDRLELLVEPVFYTAILPKTGAHAKGLGDVEVTATYLAIRESGAFPALAFAAEVKVPTARNKLIGTGSTDYTGYLIASKRFGAFDTHANLSYAIIGEPAGTTLNNVFGLALAAEWHLNPKLDLVGEFLTNTAAAPEGSSEQDPLNPEVAGAEMVGMLGTQYQIAPKVMLALGVTYDNNQAVLIRPGLTFFLR